MLISLDKKITNVKNKDNNFLKNKDKTNNNTYINGNESLFQCSINIPKINVNGYIFSVDRSLNNIKNRKKKMKKNIYNR